MYSVRQGRWHILHGSVGFSGAGIKGCDINDCSSKYCPISAVSPRPTTNVVEDNNGQYVKHVYHYHRGDVCVTDNAEGEPRADENDDLVRKCSVPRCPPPGDNEGVEIMFAV